MKFRTALIGGVVAAQILHGAALGIGMALIPLKLNGKSYATQASSSAAYREYETTFGDNWASVRTFRLLRPLDKPLKVYVETAHAGQETPYKPQYRTYVIESLNTWASVLDGRLHYVLTNKKKNADITVDWVSSFPERLVAGVTNYSVGHASVEIKTLNIPEKDIKGNIIHEFGHALGISGHSNNPDDIMVGVRRWHRDSGAYEPRLSSRDVQAIRRLYSATWKTGEDLFSANAQNAQLYSAPAIANNPETPLKGAQSAESSIMIQPIDDLVSEMGFKNSTPPNTP